MKTAERIRLIKEAAASLSARPRSEIQLILAEHGVEIYDYDSNRWNEPDEDALEYCTGRLRTCQANVLLDIHQYLVGDDAAPTPAGSERVWGDNPVAVFISHCHEDAAFVGELSRLLAKNYGIDAFVSHAAIDPSLKWRETIRQALRTCDFMVALLHDRFHESQWCDQEVGWAMGRDIPIMPVRLTRLTGPRMDGFLEEHQDCVVDTTRLSADTWLAGQILEQVVKDPRTHSVGVSALVEAFVNSYSFDRTRQLWPLISQEPYLATEQLRRLEYAVASNRQVYDANVDGELAPVLVNALVQKFEPPPPAPAADPWAVQDPPF